MEDAIDAMTMIFEGGQTWLLGWCMVFIFFVSLTNYAGKVLSDHGCWPSTLNFLPFPGFAVTKTLSATTSSVLRQVSTLI